MKGEIGDTCAREQPPWHGRAVPPRPWRLRHTGDDTDVRRYRSTTEKALELQVWINEPASSEKTRARLGEDLPYQTLGLHSGKKRPNRRRRNPNRRGAVEAASIGASIGAHGGGRLGRRRPECGGDRGGDALAAGSHESRGGAGRWARGRLRCGLVGATDRPSRLV